MGRLIALWAVLAAGPAAGGSDAPVVVELFTSQGCYSCPPAEKYLGELAGREDVIALEFHVDYWDQLVYGFAGKWKDPFSSPHHTNRQRAYNIAIRGRSQVYTPQMVVAGRGEAVGSSQRDVERLIERSATDGASALAVTVARTGSGGLTVAVNGPVSTPAEVWLVRFDLRQLTEVRSGENKGKTLVSRNVVREVSRLGPWVGRPARFSLPRLRLGDNEGCAVLVQSASLGPLLGAGRCPGAGA